MDVYANLLYLMWIFCSCGYSLGFFQWDTSSSETVACVGNDANLEWKYNSNETILTLSWQKVGPPDISMASYFSATFIPSNAYAGRISQTQPGSASVTLTSVSSADNGTYRCTVQSTYVTLIDLIVAETPSGLPFMNKTADTLMCNPPQNEGTPNVETILKENDGNILNTLSVQSPGTYHCCIRGSAVRCLGSTNNTTTEVCVNATINVDAATTSITTEGTTTTTTTNKTTQHHVSSVLSITPSTTYSGSTNSSRNANTKNMVTNSVSVTTKVNITNDNNKWKKSYTTYIIIGSVGGSALIVLMCVVTIVLKKRVSSKSNSLQKTEQYPM